MEIVAQLNVKILMSLNCRSKKVKINFMLHIDYCSKKQQYRIVLRCMASMTIVSIQLNWWVANKENLLALRHVSAGTPCTQRT